MYIGMFQVGSDDCTNTIIKPTFGICRTFSMEVHHICLLFNVLGDSSYCGVNIPINNISVLGSAVA